MDSLAPLLDVLEVDHSQGYLLALLSPAEAAGLAARGVKVEIDDARSGVLLAARDAAAGQASGIPGYACYRTVTETYASLQQLADARPNLVAKVKLGVSWDRATPDGPPGWDLNAYVLTNRNANREKHRYFLLAEVHAREYATAELATRFAELLVTQYGRDPDVTWLLDYAEIHILPLANPDGRLWAEQGQPWRKNTDNANGCDSFPYYGTDLNRNYVFRWDETGGASTEPCAETYKGPSAASEPETQAVQAYVRSLFPDQRGPAVSDAAPSDASGLLVSLHSYGELVLYPWGWTDQQAPNAVALRTLARKFAYLNNYTPGQSSPSLYKTTGDTTDWAYGELGLAAYTFELGGAFFQDCASFENEILSDNLAALLYGLKAARRPYLSPAGPDVVSPTVSAPVVAPGQTVTVTAVASTARQSGGAATQTVAAARYSLDVPSWVPGTLTYPLAAGDGAFDSASETAWARLETTLWTAGRHTLFVEAQDTSDNWGAPSAVFVFYGRPVYLPHVGNVTAGY